MSAHRQLERLYEEVRNDIYALCRELNFSPTHQQRELLDLVQKPTPHRKKIAVKSGKGPGKSTVSGVVALWWCLRTYGVKIILTAPTLRQCKDVWLAEVGRTVGRANPWLKALIEITGTRVKIADHPTWGVQIMTATSPEAALGFHEKNLKVIVEEASGVSREIMRALKDTLSNPSAAMLLIGNPTTRDGDFFDAFNSKRGEWETLTFNAEETPPSEWFDPGRNAEIEREFGRDSDVYRVAVLGEFPHADPNCVISSDDLEKCTYRKNILPMARLSDRKQIGLDFARFGGDELVVYRISGNAVVQWHRMTRTDPSRLVAMAFRWQAEAGWKDDETLYVPDAGGMGQGIMHRFYDAEKTVVEFHNGGKASESMTYANKITEAWFGLGKLVKAKQCYIPNDGILLAQLASRQYKLDNKGKLILETKDEFKKRTGQPSPDRADALCYAFYEAALNPEGSVS